MIKAQVTEIAGERATLKLEDGQVLALPLTAVEGSVKPGQEVALVAAAFGGEDAGRQAVARHLLNELLKG